MGVRGVREMRAEGPVEVIVLRSSSRGVVCRTVRESPTCLHVSSRGEPETTRVNKDPYRLAWLTSDAPGPRALEKAIESR